MDEMYRLDQFHKVYQSRGGTLNKRTFRKVVKAFLRHTVDSILEGHPFKIGYGVGTIHIKKVEYVSGNKVGINWGLSNKYKQELLDEGKPLYNKDTGQGYEWLIYHSGSIFYRFHWKRVRIPLINNAIVLRNAIFYQLDIHAKTRTKLSKSINELSPIIHDGIQTDKF